MFVNGSFDALSTINTANSLDVALKTASSFMDKKFLLDVTAGWHHQDANTLPVDGSRVGDTTGPRPRAPRAVPPQRAPEHHRLRVHR